MRQGPCWRVPSPMEASCAECSATLTMLQRRAPPCVLLTAKCGHSTICEECLPRKFEFLDRQFRGIIQCPTCAMELRDSDYSSKTPEELKVEQALQIRRKIKKEYVAQRKMLPPACSYWATSNLQSCVNTVYQRPPCLLLCVFSQLQPCSVRL